MQRIRAQAAVTKEECQVVEAEAKEGVGQLSDGGTMRLSAVSGLEISRFCGIYGVNYIYSSNRNSNSDNLVMILLSNKDINNSNNKSNTRNNKSNTSHKSKTSNKSNKSSNNNKISSNDSKSNNTHITSNDNTDNNSNGNR